MANSKTLKFNPEFEFPTPADVIFYMLAEAQRRTDNPDGAREFGWAGESFFYHQNLFNRINEYVERYKNAH